MRAMSSLLVSFTAFGLVLAQASAEDYSSYVNGSQEGQSVVADSVIQPVFYGSAGAGQKLDEFGEQDCGCGGKGSCGKGCGGGCCTTTCNGQRYLLPQGERLHMYGWIDAGFIGNTDSPASRFNGPYNGVDRSNEAMMNQLYLVTELGLPTDGGFGFGGRFDLLYGEDFLLAESAGLERNPDGTPQWNNEYYGLAIPQAYVEAGTDALSVKVGHFYSPVGYEGVMSPYNFFYSKSYSYQFAGPFTHWGGMLTWKPNDCWQVQLALHNGWDALDRVEDHMGVIAGIKYANPCRDWWTSFTVTTGDEFNNLAGNRGVAPDFTNRTRYSYLLSLPIACRWEYVFHHWLGYQENGAVGGQDALWYGVDQYLYYTINDCWKAGFRVEWFRDEDGTRLGLNRPSNPNNPPFVGDVLSLSLGVNWTPLSNLVIRPEIRADFYDGQTAAQPYDDGASDRQFMIGIDGILKF